jgi:hypothetical protein
MSIWLVAIGFHFRFGLRSLYTAAGDIHSYTADPCRNIPTRHIPLFVECVIAPSTLTPYHHPYVYSTHSCDIDLAPPLSPTISRLLALYASHSHSHFITRLLTKLAANKLQQVHSDDLLGSHILPLRLTPSSNTTIYPPTWMTTNHSLMVHRLQTTTQITTSHSKTSYGRTPPRRKPSVSQDL